MDGRARRALAWGSGHPALVAAVVYALLSVLMVGQGLLPDRTLSGSDYFWSVAPWQSSRPSEVKGLGANFELVDAAEVFQPFLQHTRDSLPDVPLWNPHIMGGRPYVAGMQSAIFSPFSLPTYVLPFWTSLGVVAVLKLFLAAFGTYLLARALGMRFGGALIAGLVFAFGTFFVVWLPWPLTNVFPLIPWILLLTELLVRRPGPLPASGLAALVALQYFGGHPESSFHALFAAVCFFAFRVLTTRPGAARGLRPLVRPVAAFTLALVVGTAIAALVLLPFVELLLNSGDLSRRLHTDAGHWPRKYLGALLLHDYWGRSTQHSNVEPFMAIRGWYAGALTLMLAAAALILRPTRVRLAVAGFALFSGLMVLGIQPLFAAVTQLPGFRTAHNQRMLIFVLLGLALLAGWGLDELSARRPVPRRRRALVLAAGGVVFCTPIAWMLLAGTLSLDQLRPALEVAWGFDDPPPVPPLAPGGRAADIVRDSALLQWLPLAGLGLALVALCLRAARRIPATAFVTLAALLLAVDLFRANMGYNPAIPKDTASQPATPAIRYLQSRRPARFAGAGLNIAFQPLPADLAMRYDLYDARGYDYPVEKRFDRLWRRNVAPGIPDFAQPVEVAGTTPAAVRALSLLSVADFIQGPQDPPLRTAGLRLVYHGRDAAIYANERALPRLFLVGRQRVVADGDTQLAAATAPGFDARRVAITEEAIPGVPQGSDGPATPPGRARLVSYGDERVLAETSASRQALLVLTDVHFPGWKASIDGRSVPLERVNYLLRGVAVPPGAHRVELRYEPASWRAGWIISLAGLLALGAAVAAGLRPRRKMNGN